MNTINTCLHLEQAFKNSIFFNHLRLRPQGPKVFQKLLHITYATHQNNMEEQKKIEHKVLPIKPGHQHDVQ